MLTYTLSRREKALLLVFAVFLLAIIWYHFVFVASTNQKTELDSQIATVQTQQQIARKKIANMKSMQKTIDQCKAEGVKPKIIPEYDNIRLLTAELNSVLAATESYTISFPELNKGESYLERSVDIVYGCSSYEAAEEIVNTLANGSYPCSIGAVSIVDTSARTDGSSSTRGLVAGSNVSVSLSVTYYEKLADEEATTTAASDSSAS